MGLSGFILLIVVLVKLSSVFGCLSTSDHQMPSTTPTVKSTTPTTPKIQERQCCPMNLLDPLSTARGIFDPPVYMCPEESQLTCR
ncbi:hypothetical protein L596_029898 [Steinernema carpocapsae]|uniref:Uncharacterized protein n=1 Tax=Steinernema carpocapsae TaxID=34508 RepID=A0A4U5LR49_STECR|nr:hypothetical protein L596_029898 [Steinernema carpocapsae]